MEPLSLGAIFASIGSAFKFADLAVRVAEVGSENEVFVRTIKVVRDDLNEVERLLNVDHIQRKLTSTPGKLPWVRGAILNTKSSLNDIGKWVERARSEQEANGEIRFDTRVRWVFNDHEKLVNRKNELMTCHQQLSNVLGYLLRLEDSPPTQEPPTYLDTTFFDDILSKHRRSLGTKEPFSDSTPNLRNVEVPSMASNQSKCSFYPPGHGTIRSTSIPSLTPTDGAMSPSSLSSSPPPSYMSITRPTSHEEVPWTGKGTVHTHHYTERPEPTGGTIPQRRRVEPQIWAYNLTSEQETTPELPGDTVIMSGINSFGPVNPFDFSADQRKPHMSINARYDESRTRAELRGDSRFPNELPAAHDSGPPPGYPRRATEKLPSSRGDDWLEVQAYRNEHRRSMPELPDASSYLSAQPHPFSQHVHSSARNTHHTQIPELGPSQYSNPPASLQRRATSPNVPSNPTVSFAPPIPSKVPCPPASRDESIPSTPSNCPARPTESASMARMRRQQDMMDLLSSIEL